MIPAYANYTDMMRVPWGLGGVPRGLGDPSTQLGVQLSNAIIQGAKVGTTSGVIAGAASAGL